MISESNDSFWRLKGQCRILYGPCPHPPTDLKLVSSEAHPSIDHDYQNDLLQMYGVLEIHDILVSLIIN